MHLSSSSSSSSVSGNFPRPPTLSSSPSLASSVSATTNASAASHANTPRHIKFASIDSTASSTLTSTSMNVVPPTPSPYTAPSVTNRNGLISPSHAASGATSNTSNAIPMPGSSTSSAANPSSEFAFLTGSLDSMLVGYYPRLLESMRLDGRISKVRGKALASQSWKKILSFVIESSKASSASSMGGGGLPIGMKKKDLPPPRNDQLRGFGAADEVYGLGGGYNPLLKERSVRGSGGGSTTGSKSVRGREPDTEEWSHWQSEDWKAWKEYRQREKDWRPLTSKLGSNAAAGANGDGANSNGTGAIAPTTLLTGGMKNSNARAGNGVELDPQTLLANAQAKLKRDDLKSSMDLNLDLNPLDHIHTVRRVHAHTNGATGGGKKSKSALAAHAKAQAHDTKFQREQKKRAIELYRNIWIQQMKVLKSNRALSHYGALWDRKLQGYKMTLERDSQGNKIKALHLLDEKTRRKVLAAQNGLASGSGDPFDWSESDENGNGGSNSNSDTDDNERAGLNGHAGGGSSDNDDTNGHLHTSGTGGDTHASAMSTSSSSMMPPLSLKKLQSSNPHKHIYHSGSMSARNFRSHPSMNDLAVGSMTARSSSAHLASHHQQFDAMLTNGLAQSQTQSSQPSPPPPPTTTASRPRLANLFSRAVLSLKNRKSILAFTEPELAALKEIFDALAREGYSKIPKTAFKTIIATNFGQQGVGPVSIAHHANQASASGGVIAGGGNSKGSAGTSGTGGTAVTPIPIYIDRTRLDPLLDRLWLAVNSNGRNTNFLDFADWSQMVGIALNATVEDKAAFCFEIYDMDDDGFLDIHDLFVCLNLSLDEYFPNDFHLIATNLYEKMDAYERIWKRRAEKMMEMAASSVSTGIGAGQQPQQQQQQLHLSSSSDPYIHQELPLLHITKSEFIRLHQQAAAAAATAASHAQTPSTANDTHHHTHQPHPPTHGSSHSAGGAHHFRNNQYQQQQQQQHNSSPSVKSLHHQFDLIELISKSFFYPYNKSGKNLFQSAVGNSSHAGVVGMSLRDRERDKEKEKERQMFASIASSSGKIAAQFEEKTPSAVVVAAAVTNGSTSTSKQPLTHAQRIVSHARRSVHTMEEIRNSSPMPSGAQGPSPTASTVPSATTATAMTGKSHGASHDASVDLSPTGASSDIDQLLHRLRASSASRVSKPIFRKLFLQYLANGPNHQFHALNPAQAALDIAEEEKIIEFLFYALDIHKNGSLDGNYAAAMLNLVLKGDVDAQLKFYHRLLDLDRDGAVTAKDLCMAHDITTSYTLRSDLNVLLDVFSSKVEHVILNTRRSVHEIEERNRHHVNLRDVMPENVQPSGNTHAINHADAELFAEIDELDDIINATSATSALSSPTGSPNPPLDQHQQLAQLRRHAHVGITLEELNDSLLKFNPSLFLKILKRVPYQREKRFQAMTAPVVRLASGMSTRNAPHSHMHAHKSGEDASGAVGIAHGIAGAIDAMNGSGFEELHHLHRSIMREMKVSTQIDFSAQFPDAHNSNIGDQIANLRRSIDFQQDCQFETRIFYLANQFHKIQTLAPALPNQPPPTVQALMDSAYHAIQRLLTRVPQVYVQWTLLQDGSKHTSIETAKFRKAASKYGLLTKSERRKARFRMVATPGAIYAYGGFPRKNGETDRADLQHYGTPLRCVLLGVSGAQLNEEGLDDIDFIRIHPDTGEKYIDQPQYFFEMCAQVHMWLTGFVDMIELENLRAMGGHLAQQQHGSQSISYQPKSGLMRIPRIGAGNFAHIQGVKEHQGNLIAYLLMHAVLYNLRKNSQTIQPTPTTVTPNPPTQTHTRRKSSVGTHSRTHTNESSVLSSPSPPQPAVVSGYRNLSVIEFILFDDDACPIPPDPLDGNRRMCGGVELRFSHCDILELTTHQTSNHHIGIVAPMDSFALPGNEDAYTSLGSCIGNNTSLRLHQSYHFNVHLLHQQNYIPIEVTPELNQPSFGKSMWKEMKSILNHEKSPKQWMTLEDEMEEQDFDDEEDVEYEESGSEVESNGEEVL